MIARLSLVILVFAFGLMSSVALPTRVVAQTREWSGVCVYSDEEGETDVATIQGLECLIANVFTVILSLIGFSALVMFIIASFKWMISGGNSKGIESAKGTLTYAVVGIIVALSAFIILNFIAQFTGVSVVTQFRIPTSDEGL